MNAVEDAFRRAGNGFQKWSGRELFREAYQQLDPLQSSDPVHWFSAIVSHLSCLIESADSAWHALVQYEYNAATGDIEAGSAPDFYRVLGRIRTSLQHTLSPNRASDRDSIAVVRDWYFNGCGTDIPARYHWRTLTNLLIQGVRVAPERLALCVEKIPVCSARSIVESQIELYARRLSREDWRAHILASVQALAPELDVDRVLEKYLPELQEGLGKSAAAIDQVIKKARELAEAVVILEAARCPVSPRDLVDMGIKPGPQLGVFHRRIELEWQRDPQQTREHLLQVALALVEKF